MQYEFEEGEEIRRRKMWKYGEQAEQDVMGWVKKIKSAKCRKMVPEWCVPNEIWRMMSHHSSS